VVNALIFNRSDEPRVTIGGSVVDGGVVLTVSDNGIGVGHQHHEAVFELFRRLNARDEYPGNGAGLTRCKRLIEMQGGTIRLASSDGGGTVVSFTLPCPAGLGVTP
jgi:light-regulated signal transduction histidine kinase (bacteriophytochrome)